jgi:hypothetical protein
VLAQREELDVADDPHLVVVDVEGGLVEERVRIGVISLGQLDVHAPDAVRRSDQADTIRVLPQLHEEGPDRLRDLAAG